MSKVQYIAGGGTTPPFTYYEPVFLNTGNSRRYAALQAAKLAAAKAEKEKKKDDDFFSDKNFMDMLGKINGLPSDMQLIFSSVQLFYSMKSLGLDSMDPSLVATKYLLTMAKVKEAYFNKQQYDNAYLKLLSNDALNEKAINLDGSLVALNKDGEIRTITLDTYKKNREDYRLLTNSELLEMRAYKSPFLNSLFNVTNNGIGFPLINKLIKEALQNLGTFTTSENVYTLRKAKGMIEGIEAIQEAAYQGKLDPRAGVDGIYNVSVVTKTQAQQCKQAINYILDVLPDNAKTLLALRFPEGKAEDYVYRVITDAVTASQSGTSTLTRTLVPEKEEKEGGKKAGKTGSDKESEDITNNDLLLNIILATGGSNTTYTMQDKDGRFFSISGTQYPNLSVDANNPVPQQCSLQLLLTTYNLSGILDNTSQFAITFGSLILNYVDFKDVVFLNDMKATRAVLPVKPNDDPNTKYDHRYVPDLDFMSKHKDIVDAINKYGLNSQEVRNMMLSQNLLDPTTGEIDTSMFRPYLVVDGLATEKQIKNDTHATLLVGDERDKYMLTYKNGVYKAKENEGKDNKSDVSDGWFRSDKLYSGSIFLPITQNVLQGKIAAGTNVRQTRADQIQEDYDRMQNLRNMNSTSASDL